MKRALIVFAKTPQSGKVKTRLVPPLTFDEAKELYTCFLKDALVQYARLAELLNVKIFLFVAPENSVDYFKNFINDFTEKNISKALIKIMTQSGSDLGEKMFNAFSYVFSEKYGRTVVIGTDHPTLPDGYVAGAFEKLEQINTDCVIGPTEDGGFYLLGLKDVHRHYFSNVSWSTDAVFDQTVGNLNRAGKSVYTLPEWYDVDDKESLFKMIEALSQSDINDEPVYSKRFLNQMKTVEV